MVEAPGDDGMIEIGDPAEEPATAEPPPKVVVEYRDRGIPLMLVPPMILVVAVAAAFTYHKLAPRFLPTPPPPVAVKAPGPVAVPALDLAPPANPPGVPGPTVAPEPTPATLEPAPAPAPTPAPEATIADPPKVAEPPPAEPPAIPEPAAGPRVAALGFDPKAFEAETKVQARDKPEADPAVAPAGQGAGPIANSNPNLPPDASPDMPGRAEPPATNPADGLEKPRTIDPDLLPPDPRLARQRRIERMSEARRQLDLDRVDFHAGLAEICRSQQGNSPMAILRLMNDYGTTVEESSKQKAAEALGKTGRYAGVGRGTRVKLLRTLGWPEAAILNDIYDQEEQTIGGRNAPRNRPEALHRAALILLKFPPARVDTPADRP